MAVGTSTGVLPTPLHPPPLSCAPLLYNCPRGMLVAITAPGITRVPFGIVTRLFLPRLVYHV